jgi:outer membrane protein assembly factor BamA
VCFLVLVCLLAQEPPPPPDFLNQKRPLPEETLKRKAENWYATGIPTIGVDPEVGPIFGAQVQIFDNGERSSPFFAYSPYRRQIGAGAMAGTEGNFWSAFVTYDQPYLDDSPWRVRSYVGATASKERKYFGTGEQTLDRLHYPGADRTFSHFDDFENAIEQNVGGVTWAHYNEYQQRILLGAFNLEYDLMGGLLRPLIGVQFGRIGVTDYTGRQENGAVIQETKLAEDNRLGKIRGFEGGWDNNLRIGLSYDSRNYEPDPTSGILAQAFLSGAMRPLGSEFNYGVSTLGLTAYVPPFPDYDRLVAVGNALAAFRFGDVPFYAMNRLSLPKDEVRTGLGGFPTLRGYNTNRFVGRTTLNLNAELRWSFAEFTLWDQRLKTAVAPFVDTGRVFDTIGAFSTERWKTSWGIGFRLAWNLATVISFDYSISPEGSLFFMQLGQPF